MYYVYMLQSPDQEHIYVGFSSELRNRMKQHNASEHPEWKLVYYEAYREENDARLRERRLKHHGSGIAELKKRLTRSLGGRSAKLGRATVNCV